MPTTLFFTAFEPSGDHLAAPVIRELLSRRPGLRVRAFGGPRMREAGADVVEVTTEDAHMGFPTAAKIREHFHLNARIDRWLSANPIDLHVPVDSPAANFPICKLTRARETPIVHLAAPQMWAWASWRIRKLRRLTDLVLCLLPFEPEWFRSRGVEARFIGHPIFERELDGEALRARGEAFPAPSGGGARVALLPGSRPKEWTHNFPILLRAFDRLRNDRPGTVGVVTASSARAEAELRRIADAEVGRWPDDLLLAQDAVDGAALWSDLCLAVSGTVTLQLSRATAPMALVYHIAPWQYHALGRWIIRSHSATLPNLIAGRRIVPEFVPCTGDGAAYIEAAAALLADPAALERQRADLQSLVCEPFNGKRAASEAAGAILEKLRA
ncbi:MAG: hypothetical protein IBJ10_04335 [Phycisphaerales bacterium]|nr:hypothetical protein [Phycisphaerales bacterium]